jgi:hypothetical protein
VPGRKSDIQECQWLLKLHAFGLLNNSLQPTDEIRVARTLWRHRGNLVAEASSAIQRMQKALIAMNLQLSNVLSDLSGVSGMTRPCARVIKRRPRGRLPPGATKYVRIPTSNANRPEAMAGKRTLACADPGASALGKSGPLALD